jgi:DNA-binding IclR family transcriptional regulator
MGTHLHYQRNTVAAPPGPDETDGIRMLAAATGGTVMLVRWSDDSLRCVLRCDPPPQSLAIPPFDCGVLLPGTEALLHVMLAWSSPDVLARRLGRIAPALLAVRNRALLALQLSRVRTVGHDIATGGLRGEVTSIAAPLRDGHGQVVAGLALVAPSVYLEDLDLDAITADVRHQAADLEILMAGAG